MTHTLTYARSQHGDNKKKHLWAPLDVAHLEFCAVHLQVSVDVTNDNQHRYVLKLNKSLYGLKQAGYNWFKKHYEGLEVQDFIQSQVDKCVFFRKDCIIHTYVDDCIILAKYMADFDSVISSFHEGTENFQLVDQGSIDKYLGVLIQDINATSFEMSQLFLFCRILGLLSLDKHETKGCETPVGKPLLNGDLGGVPCKHT